MPLGMEINCYKKQRETLPLVFPGTKLCGKGGRGASGTRPNKGRTESKEDTAGARRASEPPQRAQQPWGSVFSGQCNLRVNQLLFALRLAGGFLGLPGAHLLVAWGLLPQSTRAPPCGATAPHWKTDLRPEKAVLTNGSGPTHLLVTMGISQRTFHPPFHRTFR